MIVGRLICRTWNLETNLCKCPRTQAEAELIAKRTGQPSAEIKNDTIKDKTKFIKLIQNLRV